MLSLRCLLAGHDDLIAREPGRLFLRCFTCGRETPGWTLGPPAPRPARRGRFPFTAFTSGGARVFAVLDC